ncbi:MAG TPA: 6-phosphogluconolactonase [Candidatus Dormibacteraeota bacterium]|jgi:6-phosphogluconolactonase|nr:6-phosphogluconolactonase [Candidatus Dormibacteraeota bacterium]
MMVVRFRDAAGVARAGAAEVVDAAFKAIREHGDFRLLLAGGSTPRATYELLAGELRAEVDWRRVSLWFGDERCVPPDDPRSNYRMVREALIDPLRLSPSMVNRIAGELPPEAAAAEYDVELKRLRRERAPIFDLALLGMGPEGHTASLFPGSPTLAEHGRLAMAVEVPAQPPLRVTLTPEALGLSRGMVFLVTGPGKAEALARVFGEGDVPAALVASLAPSQFFVDDAAATELPT